MTRKILIDVPSIHDDGLRVFEGIPDGTDFYFVHSYYVEPDDKTVVAGETGYGVAMCSMVVKGNVIATQFHPEKSGEYGLRLYDNFIRLAKVV